ncbi:hypothetical protein BC834DRAFT_900278 [Gloeopeniophorella convolvens]|nr:hypothetical protein BC834DRAFT_900278 [Gloeopeniophorella convolvens]
MEQKLWHEENELQSRLDECERREEDLRHKETDFLRREHELVQMEEANAQRELRLNNRLQHVLRRELEVVERERAVSRSPPGAPSPPTEAVSDPADDRETRMRSSRRDTLTSEISAQYTIRSVLSTNERTNHTYSPRRDRLNVSGQPNLPP